MEIFEIMYLNVPDSSRKTEKCAGKNCTNEGNNKLIILYLNKSGWFCNSCKQELLFDDLTVEQEKGDT